MPYFSLRGAKLLLAMLSPSPVASGSALVSRGSGRTTTVAPFLRKTAATRSLSVGKSSSPRVSACLLKSEFIALAAMMHSRQSAPGRLISTLGNAVIATPTRWLPEDSAVGVSSTGIWGLLAQPESRTTAAAVSARSKLERIRKYQELRVTDYKSKVAMPRK